MDGGKINPELWRKERNTGQEQLLRMVHILHGKQQNEMDGLKK